MHRDEAATLPQRHHLTCSTCSSTCPTLPHRPQCPACASSSSILQDTRQWRLQLPDLAAELVAEAAVPRRLPSVPGVKEVVALLKAALVQAEREKQKALHELQEYKQEVERQHAGEVRALLEKHKELRSLRHELTRGHAA